MRPKVYVLYTGGTFGMCPHLNIPGNPLTPMPLPDLQRILNSKKEIGDGMDITLEQFERLIDSSGMEPGDWVKIARKIHEKYQDHDGFVVIQGTDTMAYTASALSFIFANLAKPVVITGSQLPLQNPHTDAWLNYAHALMVAGYQASDLPLIAEVVLVFAGKILRGCRARKISTSSRAGFDSPNAPPLGEIGERMRIDKNQLRPPPPASHHFQLNDTLSEAVLDISLYPGFTGATFAALRPLNARGIVLRTYGAGNAPGTREFLTEVQNIVQKQSCTVVNITQCLQGSVQMGLYESSVGLLDAGVISGFDMTPEAALTKLMVILGSSAGEKIKRNMQIDQRGEQSQNLFDFVFKPKKIINSNNYVDCVVPDFRFNPCKLQAATLRIKPLTLIPKDAAGQLSIFMNHPNAGDENLRDDHPKLIHTVKIKNQPYSGSIVYSLRKEQVKNIIGNGDIILSFVASGKLAFKFDQLHLTLLTRS